MPDVELTLVANVKRGAEPGNTSSLRRTGRLRYHCLTQEKLTRQGRDGGVHTTENVYKATYSE